jgi:hypothetical protein
VSYLYPEPPKRLYKYVSAKRAVQILRDRTIRFTQPRVLNDPFECCPALDLSALKNEYLSAEDVGQRMADGEERKITMRGFAEFCRGVACSYARDSDELGILSLSERCDVPLMWSHYADEHRGLVIGIDPMRVFDCCPFPSGPEEVSDCRPVRYSKGRFKIPSSREPLGHMFVKDSCWAYEKEWRVVRGLKSLSQPVSSIYTAEFPPEAIVCIVQGLFTSKETMSELRDVLRSGYSGVESYATVFDASGFELDITTGIGRALDDDDVAWEAAERLGADDLYRYTSKGELFKAMEIIPDWTEFQLAKTQLGF